MLTFALLSSLANAQDYTWTDAYYDTQGPDPTAVYVESADRYWVAGGDTEANAYIDRVENGLRTPEPVDKPVFRLFEDGGTLFGAKLEGGVIQRDPSSGTWTDVPGYFDSVPPEFFTVSGPLVRDDGIYALGNVGGNPGSLLYDSGTWVDDCVLMSFQYPGGSRAFDGFGRMLERLSSTCLTRTFPSDDWVYLYDAADGLPQSISNQRIRFIMGEARIALGSAGVFTRTANAASWGQFDLPGSPPFAAKWIAGDTGSFFLPATFSGELVDSGEVVTAVEADPVFSPWQIEDVAWGSDGTVVAIGAGRILTRLPDEVEAPMGMLLTVTDTLLSIDGGYEIVVTNQGRTAEIVRLNLVTTPPVQIVDGDVRWLGDERDPVCTENAIGDVDCLLSSTLGPVLPAGETATFTVAYQLIPSNDYSDGVRLDATVTLEDGDDSVSEAGSAVSQVASPGDPEDDLDDEDDLDENEPRRCAVVSPPLSAFGLCLVGLGLARRRR